MRILLALTMVAATGPVNAAGPIVAATAPTSGATMATTRNTAAATTVPRFTLDTPIEALMADAAAKLVIAANLPDLSAHPMYDQFKSMSLTQLAPMSGGKLSEATLAKTKAELAALK